MDKTDADGLMQPPKAAHHLCSYADRGFADEKQLGRTL